jgi:hypothetical protein
MFTISIDQNTSPTSYVVYDEHNNLVARFSEQAEAQKYIDAMHGAPPEQPRELPQETQELLMQPDTHDTGVEPVKEQQVQPKRKPMPKGVPKKKRAKKRAVVEVVKKAKKAAKKTMKRRKKRK